MFAWHDEARTFWFDGSTPLESEAEFLLVGLVRRRALRLRAMAALLMAAGASSQVLGLAIHNGSILDLHLPSLLWERLLNEPVGLAHLKQVSPDLARGLQAMLDYEGDDVESVFCAEFSVESPSPYGGDPAPTELVPGGADRAVNNANRAEYAALYADQVLVTSVSAQVCPHHVPAV